MGMRNKQKIKFNPIDCHSKPKYKIGTIFIDQLRQEWKYCGVKMARGIPMIYRWIPFAWIATFAAETKGK